MPPAQHASRQLCEQTAKSMHLFATVVQPAFLPQLNVICWRHRHSQAHCCVANLTAVSLVCESCPQLIGPTNKKQRKRELSAAIQTLLSQHGKGLWVDTGVQQPKWVFDLGQVLQSQQQALDALFQFMPALAPRVLDPHQASVAIRDADKGSSTAPVGQGTAVAGDSKGHTIRSSSTNGAGSAARASGLGSSSGSGSADTTSSAAPSQTTPAAAVTEAVSQSSTTVPVPVAPALTKLGATAALEYVGVLPGFAQLEVSGCSGSKPGDKGSKSGPWRAYLQPCTIAFCASYASRG